MARWHQTFSAQIGLRFGGTAVLSLAWVTGSILYAKVHSHAPQEASLGELGLCAMLVVLGIVGSALLCVGPRLWKQVELPERRKATLVETYEFHPLSYQRLVVLRPEFEAEEGPSEGRAAPSMSPRPRSQAQPRDFGAFDERMTVVAHLMLCAQRAIVDRPQSSADPIGRSGA